MNNCEAPEMFRCSRFKRRFGVKTLFHETFETVSNGLPGGWYVENNSNLKAVPAIRCGEKCIELLSAGNKFLPVIPDVSDCVVKAVLSFDFSMTKNDFEGGFAFLTSFRYDTVTGRGQALRMSRNQKNETVVYEYGTVRRNIFTKSEAKEISVPDSALDKPFELQIEISGTSLTVKGFGESVSFRITEGKGKIAIAREHFFDVLRILAYDIETDEELVCNAKRSFTIPVSEEPSYYPMFCDVELEDYGNCMDVSLSLRGGVHETPIGEGCYHGRRTDLLTNPYLKVIEPESYSKHIVYNDRIVMIPDGLADEFFYKVLAKKVEWPFRRKVRFLKPDSKFDLAFGFDSYIHAQNREFAEIPSETIFDLNGNVLYSGFGITEKTKPELLSRSDKEIIARLPKSDPRYEKAVQFAQNNHFFFEKEAPHFQVRLTGREQIPAHCRITLEDALLRPVRELNYTQHSKSFKIGVMEYTELTLVLEELDDLACGVWHLNLENTDSSVEMFRKRWAFEVMSREAGAPPPPILSGLPYLYNSRTETRGLMTDAFDPWKGKSANAPHYISCANFLPPAARKYQVYPTVRAYGRENFVWLSSRCSDNPAIADNLDLIKETDYVNISDEIVQKPLYWTYTYRDFVLKKLIEFAKLKNDDGLEVEKLEKLYAENARQIEAATLIYLAENYWEEWLDFINRESYINKVNLLQEFRKSNPTLKFAQYGPACVYASNLKGPEFIRVLQNEFATTDTDGFWQFEDYPYACRYELCSGSYFLTSSLLTLPGARFYPEIYIDGGVAGCPDGAVYYAHPPFGQRPVSYPQRMLKNVYEFCYGSGHFIANGFRFWEKCGFQACSFFQAWYENLLMAWRNVVDYRPVKPVRKAAFVSSDNSRRAAKDSMLIVKYPQYRIIDVRNTAAEDVPYIAKSCRVHGMSAGFQVLEKDLPGLSADDLSLLVLPPLKGMEESTIAHIRKLHSEGVSLLCCEDVSGLEDLFGVKDTGIRKTITWVSGTEHFMPEKKEFCDDERCTGRYETDGAEVLLSAEIPVLTIKHNEKASAAFFNVPPHLVKEDQLHDRMAYTKDGISELMEHAAAEVAAMIEHPLIRLQGNGRILASWAENGAIVMPVYNPSDKDVLSAVIEIDPSLLEGRSVSSETPVTALGNGKYRLRLEPDGTACLIIR